ncbi:MAG: phosphodiesterase [Solirubrobacterales bacterium]
MPKPTLLAQLSDLHLGAAWEGIDPEARLERVIEAVRSLPNPVDAVVVSGDVSAGGSEEECLLARRLLDRFEAPVHVLPGNHDDRARLRQAFDLPGAGSEPVDYAVDVGDLRLVVLDSNVPGQDPGAFDPVQLRWLDEQLGREPERPAILAMHHPPLVTGVPKWDGINLSVVERQALAEVVARHPQLRAIVGGHLHRVAASTLAGCPVLSVPSTYLQVLPDFEPNDFEDKDFEWTGPPGFALHVLLDGELSSQVELLGS